MSEFSLTAISPVDGRYSEKVSELKDFFSEFALIRLRVFVEIEYFIALCKLPLPELSGFDKKNFRKLRNIQRNFSVKQAQQIKNIEKITNHDVKAVEYFLKEKFDKMDFRKYREFIHFGLTSQDINNTAIPLSIMYAINEVIIPQLIELIQHMEDNSAKWKEIPMLAHTHGQPASPTRLGKEIMVFVERLEKQLEDIVFARHEGKFGGATGNFNAHAVAYPDIDWKSFADKFLKSIGLYRQEFTTQIEHYDNMAAIFDCMKRINTILIDFCRDMWTYISMEYFTQQVVGKEVGSSAMPHKVNPIDFENAEGNLGIANAYFEFLSAKLPVSRLQRDLTDSTVTRNIGVPFAHTLIAFKSILKGLSRIRVNEEKIKEDLENNWAVVAEAIQTILRKNGYPEPYEAMKKMTRGSKVNRESMHRFIDELEIPEKLKSQLKDITPFKYTGI